MVLHKIMISLFILIWTSTFSFAQSEAIDDIKIAIKSGSSKEMSKYFNTNVDVTLDEKIETFSKTQAEYVFRDFFKNNPPNSFTIVHQGSSKGGLPYAIGQYLSDDKTYRVWMRIKKSGDSYLIHEISFIQE